MATPAILNQFSCLTQAGNSGVPKCPVEWKNIYGFILTPSGATFDASSLANFITAMTTAMTATSKASRIFPVYNLAVIGDSTEAPVIQSFPTGQRKRVRDGFYDWLFQNLAGGINLQKRLRIYNASPTAHDVLFVAKSDGGGDFVIGTTPSTPGLIQAISLAEGFFAANPWKGSDGSKVVENALQFSFNPKWINELLAYVNMGSTNTQNTIQGLNDVYLSSPGANATSGSYNIYILDETGTDLATLYSTQFASASMFVYSNATTGGIIAANGTPVFVPGVGTTPGYFTVKLLTSDPNYPASGNVNITLTNPAALAAAGISYWESTGPVSIVKN
jgi:hypothetical protein